MLRHSKFELFARWLFYTAVIVGCAAAFLPANQALHAQFSDKLMHGVGFFGLAMLAHLGHRSSPFYLLFIVLSCLGLVIELVQAFLPYRSFSLLGWGADILGIVVYLAFAGCVRQLIYRQRFSDSRTSE